MALDNYLTDMGTPGHVHDSLATVGLEAVVNGMVDIEEAVIESRHAGWEPPR